MILKITKPEKMNLRCANILKYNRNLKIYHFPFFIHFFRWGSLNKDTSCQPSRNLNDSSDKLKATFGPELDNSVGLGKLAAEQAVAT